MRTTTEFLRIASAGHIAITERSRCTAGIERGATEALLA